MHPVVVEAVRRAAQRQLAFGVGVESVLARIGGDALLQDSKVEQEDAHARLGKRREQLLELLVIGVGPQVALRVGERQAACAGRGYREVFRTAGAEPGDVVGASRDHLRYAAGDEAADDIAAVDGPPGRCDRVRLDRTEARNVRQIVAADGYRDEVAFGKVRAVGVELLEFVGEAWQRCDNARDLTIECIGVVSSRAADRIIGQHWQAIDRLQRLVG